MIHPNAFFLAGEQKIEITYEETTFGRSNTNLIQINDPTVSKNHAALIYLKNQNKYYLRDFNSVNGTYLNGVKCQMNKSVAVKHKDALQIGKFPVLYNFFRIEAESDKKGKINLKDYCYELENDSIDVKNNQKYQQSNSKQNVAESIKKNQLKLKTNKIKIPEISEYLEMESSLLSSQSQKAHLQNSNKEKYQMNRAEKQHKQEPKINKKEKKIELPNINQHLSNREVEELKIQERQNNIYLLEQEAKRAKQSERKFIEEEKIKLEIEKNKYEEQLLRKQIEIEQRVRQQEEKMNDQKRKIQEQLLAKERERRQGERKIIEQQQLREKKIIEELQKEKQLELEFLRKQEQENRVNNENALRKQFEDRKKQLEFEAEVLARQYEQIYLDTLKKMKNDIEKQERQIFQLESDQTSLEEEKQKLRRQEQNVKNLLKSTRESYLHINGRNKAFILYASEIQNKIDEIKSKKSEKVSNKLLRQYQEDVANSRKLLQMKNNQKKALEDEIKKYKLQLNVTQSNSDYLDTIIENHQAILLNKQLYYQYLEEEKNLEDIWESELQQNQRIQQKNRSIHKEIQVQKRQLADNLKENIKKVCDQRLHMLKCLHLLSEDKKEAAKFLIEQMLTHEEEIKNSILSSEEIHEKIHSIIIQSERKKIDNENLSSILFGANSTAHHFDNMKIEINYLIEQVSLEREDQKIQIRSKQIDQAQKIELKIFQEIQKTTQLRDKWKKNMNSQQLILAEKNPIVFFGEVLLKKQLDIEESSQKIEKLEGNISESLVSIKNLEQKKFRLEELMEKYKREQIAKIRKDIK